MKIKEKYETAPGGITHFVKNTFVKIPKVE